RIIAKILHKIGIRENDTFIQKTSGDLISGYQGGTVENVNNAIAEAEGGTLFIDEAYTLYDPANPDKEGKKALEALLVDMENRRNAYTVILAGYKDKMKDLMKVNPGFSSRFAHTFYIPDYSEDELIEIAEQIAKEKNYIIDEKAKQGIRKRIEREKIDDKFGNARFIRKLIEEATDNLALRVAAMKNHSAKDDHLLLYEDFIDDEFDKSLDELLDELNQMVGLKKVKEQVNMLISDISYQKEALERGYDLGTGNQFMNMIFVGNAGTGKTTVAKLIGKIYYALGVLKRGDVFVESSRVDFVGQYLGSTGVNTKKMVDKAMGGILFIDEAYALCAYEDDKFGMEAVNALVKYIDQYKDRLMVIMAGYTEDMERFMKTNQGLTRRFPTIIEFEDYNAEELTDIFYSFIEKKGKNREGLRIEDGLREEIKKYLEKCSSRDGFGNAGGVVNICNRVIKNQRSRIAAKLRAKQEVSDIEFITITREDIGFDKEDSELLIAE
ncbi:MAG: AAA family ATPase, partial [Clostridiales bacterium]|nr:AAA family ATPase [Clostridiales bacterium]